MRVCCVSWVPLCSKPVYFMSFSCLVEHELVFHAISSVSMLSVLLLQACYCALWYSVCDLVYLIVGYTCRLIKSAILLSFSLILLPSLVLQLFWMLQEKRIWSDETFMWELGYVGKAQFWSILPILPFLEQKWSHCWKDFRGYFIKSWEYHVERM